MPGRGHGRLIESRPPIGLSRGRGRGRNYETRTIPLDDFTPVPFYTNQSGKISREQYERNKTNKSLHPDDAGLGQYYIGSMAWHVRNQGRIWIPREERPIRMKLRTRKEAQESRRELDALYVVLPKNDSDVALDFDQMCDAVGACSQKTSEMLWADYLAHKDDPPSPDLHNFFHPTLRPKFPAFPKNGNPFDLLPCVQDGIFPFDEYGAVLFPQHSIERWKNDPKAKSDLLEIQIRQVIKLFKLDISPTVYTEPSEGDSYGIDAPVYVDPAKVTDSKSSDKARSSSSEPDSGFHSIEPAVDPWSGNSEALTGNRYSWEDETGTGFVPLDTFLPLARYSQTQVEPKLYFI